MRLRRSLIVLVAAGVLLSACGDDDPSSLDTDDPTVVEGDTISDSADQPADPDAGDQLVHPDTPVSDIGDDPDSNPGGDIRPADGEEAPAQQVTGRVVGVDRDGPSVEIVESNIATGTDATDAARAAGEIGPDEEWEFDFYVTEGARRWVDIDPAAVVVVYDCTQACEHVAGTIEDVLSGAPYGGADALWTFVIGDEGRATAVDEIYLP